MLPTMTTYTKNTNRPPAFSVLELTAALVIMALVIAAVLALLERTRAQAQVFDHEMTRRGIIQAALDTLMNDLTSTTYADGDVKISYAQVGWQDTSHVALNVRSSRTTARLARQIDWLAAPHDDGDDLILYRRDQLHRDYEAMYIPICENIHSFYVDMLGRDGEIIEDANLAASMFEITVELYRDDDNNPDRLLKVNRIYCPKRFD